MPLFSAGFLFSHSPTITSFTPLSAEPGDVVRIAGTGFNTTTANNIVYFGTNSATVTVKTARTATTTTATVPRWSTFAPITVLHTGTVLDPYSFANFNYVYSSAKTTLTTEDFSPIQNFVTGAQPFSAAIGDLDRDGKTDLTVANLNSALVFVFRNISSSGNNVSNSFAAKADFLIEDNPFSAAIGDLDGDGKPDLAVAIKLQERFRYSASSPFNWKY